MPLDLKELKKLAETLDDNSKRELIYFLQSRTKGMSAQVRAIDEIQEQKHKDGLVCPLYLCQESGHRLSDLVLLIVLLLA